MMSTLYIIMAAGEGKRWNNHTGVPKYLVEIDGESLIDRTMRLLRENGQKKIRILSNNEALLEYDCYFHGENETGKEIDRFLNALPLIGGEEEICFLYGDVFYTEEAIKTIVDHPAQVGRYKGFKAFGRYTPFRQYGKSWGGGELFGLKIRDYSKFVSALAAVNKYGESKSGTGWLVYRKLEGVDLEEHTVGSEFVNIDDFTNDFDIPKDYWQWKGLWEHHKQQVDPVDQNDNRGFR